MNAPSDDEDDLALSTPTNINSNIYLINSNNQYLIPLHYNMFNTT